MSGDRQPNTQLSDLQVEPVLVTRLRAVMARRDEVEGLLAKARAAKGHVKPEIFTRVVQDYQARLASIKAELDPLMAELSAVLRNIAGKRAELVNEAESLSEVVEEQRFRKHLGEFPTIELTGRVTDKQARLEELRRQLNEINATFVSAEELIAKEGIGPGAVTVPDGIPVSKPNLPAPKPIEPAPAAAAAPAAAPTAVRPPQPAAAQPAPARPPQSAAPPAAAVAPTPAAKPAAAAPKAKPAAAAPKPKPAAAAPVAKPAAAAPQAKPAAPPSQPKPAAAAPAPDPSSELTQPNAVAPARAAAATSQQAAPEHLLEATQPNAQAPQFVAAQPAAPAAAPAPPAAAAPPAQPAAPKLAAIRLGDASYPLGERALSIGRSKNCDIVISRSDVSRTHAKITPLQTGGWAIVAAGHSSGIKVNGEDATSAALQPGDQIAIGQVTMEVIAD